MRQRRSLGRLQAGIDVAAGLLQHKLLPALASFCGCHEADLLSGWLHGSVMDLRLRSTWDHFPPEKLADATSLTPQDFQEWVIALRKRLATATIGQRISKAKAFSNWCVREGFLESNPMGAIKRPKKNWQPDPLSEDQVTMLLDATRYSWASVRDRALVCMLLDSGIRNSELRHLTVEDITLKTGEVKIRQGKGGKDRTVLIGKRAKEALWRWMMQRPEEAKYLFCTVQGKSLSRARLAVIVRRFGECISARACSHRLRPLHAPIPAGP
jgi:site-specific recombinase XerC